MIKKRFIKKFMLKKRFIKKKIVFFFNRKKNYFLHKKAIKVARVWVKCFFKPGFKKIYFRFRKKFFVWKKKRKVKSLKHKQNFIFFFTKKRKRWPRLAFRWLKFQLKPKFKKSPLEILNLIENKQFLDFKRRYPLRLKNNVLKKRALKIKLKIYYRLTNSLWKLISAKLKKKKKLIFFFFFLEFSIATVCVRFHFLWNIRRAQYWISKGAIGVNSLPIMDINYRVQLNDFIQVIGPKELWMNKLMKKGGIYFHRKFNRSFNFSETSCIQRIGILLKVPTQMDEFRVLIRRRRKRWINLKTFLYLVNSFY